MTRFQKMVIRLIALFALLIAPQAAFAGGKSTSPNPPNYRYPQFLIDYISADASGDLILDEVRTHISSFRTWQQSPGAALTTLPLVDWRSVYPGTSYTVSLQTATWTGPLSNFPVGNENGAIWPILVCSTPPCATPSWLSSYTGLIMYTSTDPSVIADTAFSTVANSAQTAHTVQVSTSHAIPCHVEENGLYSPNHARNVSARKVYINPTIWATLSNNAKFSWVSRCMLLALNTPLNYGLASVSTLLHPTEPDVLTSIPVADRDALAAAWPLGTMQVTYSYPMPATLSPVP